MSGANKRKIAVVSSHTTSLFWFRMDMMKEFIRLGYEVVAFGQAPEGEWSEKFNVQGIKYRQIFVERNGMNPISDIKTLKSLTRILKEENPDMIFCYQAKTVIYTCLAAKKNKIHEVYPLIAGLGSIFRATDLKSKVVRTIMTLEYRIALKNSKTVMFQNNDDLSRFVELKIIKRDKCAIINGSGVNIERFRVTKLPESPAFLMISRLIKDKGVVEYLEACRAVRKKHPYVRCLLAGPYDTNPSAIKPHELQAYIDDGSVEYLGELEDVRPCISESSVFCLPSYHEGTPKTVLESMACGRAIITTDAPGCRETVKNGVNGWLVAARSVEQVVEKMETFIKDTALIKKMGIEGRRLVEEKYDVNKVNESISKIMKL